MGEGYLVQPVPFLVSLEIVGLAGAAADFLYAFV